MQPSTEIEEAVRRWVRAIETKDPTGFDALSREDGSLMIGAAPGEWLTDLDAYVRLASGEAAELPSATFAIDRLAAYQEGSVGWAAVDATWTVAGMEPIPARLTFVFHRENAAWKIVLNQTSIALANDKIFVPRSG